MKFSRAKVKCRGPWMQMGIVLSLCAACVSAKPSAPSTRLDNGDVKLPALSVLQAREAAAPLDPQLKSQLARVYWCQKAPSMATQNWIWLKQFYPGSDEAREAENNLALLGEGREGEITQRMDCPQKSL